MIFVIIHGSFATLTDAWFPWLKEQLNKLGHTVILPQFPVDDWSVVTKMDVKKYIPTQNLDAWFHTFENMKNNILGDDNVCFIGHSLGPLFTLHVVEKYDINLVNAFFIAPFFEIYEKNAYVEKANATFYKKNFDFEKLRRFIPHSTVIYSDDDPYVEENKSLEFAQKMGSHIVKLKGLDHMGAESNMKKFPHLLALIKQILK